MVIAFYFKSLILVELSSLQPKKFAGFTREFQFVSSIQCVLVHEGVEKRKA